MGTPGYGAPEQMERGEATVASDIHALGVLADQCFRGNPPSTWARIIRRATSSIPSHRYPSVAAFGRAIRWRHLWRNAAWLTVALLVLAAMAKLNSGKSHVDDASGARGSMMGNITPEVLEGVMRTGRIPSQKATAEPSIMPNGAYNKVRFGGPETVKELMEQINEERSIEIQGMEP